MVLLFAWRRPLLLGGALLLLGAGVVAGYLVWAWQHLPGPGSPVYERYVQAFQIGVTALDANVPQEAAKYLSEAIDLIPQEPAGWADRGLLYIRTQRLDEAQSDLNEAQRLARDNVDIQKLLGLLAERRTQYKDAEKYLRGAIQKDPHDVETIYRLATVIDQEHGEGSDAERQRLMDQILAVKPDNVVVLIERLKLAVRGSDREAVRVTVAKLRRLAPAWSRGARAGLDEMDRELAGPLGPDAVFHVLRLDNLLKAEPGYTRFFTEVNPPTLPGAPLQSFVRLAPVANAPAPPDGALAFTATPLPGAPPGRWDVVRPVWLTGDAKVTVLAANAREVRRADAAAVLASLPVGPEGLLALDWNNDFRTDLLLAGPGGLRFYQQQGGSFADVTAKTGLPADVLKGDYYGAWAADVDLDGDLDVVLASRAGPPRLLRNNLDGTFTPQRVFAGVQGVRAFAWADLDNDGAADVALLDAGGRLHVFANERSGQFVPWPVAPPADRFLALAVMDANDDGVLDLVALRADGAIVRISDRDKRQAWDVAELARWDGLAPGAEPGTLRLLAADLDNNGAIDLLASGPQVSRAWLGAGRGRFQPLATELPAGLVAAVDLDGDGRLDLLGLSGEGRPVFLRNAGGAPYHWQEFRFLANYNSLSRESDRINSFALGGEVEVRAGTCVVKQPIAEPVVHFGLGPHSRVGVIRAVWTNGTVQAEFEKPIDQPVVATQRLSGSCPFLFTWDGERFVFVTDFMWSSPLGVYEGEGGQGGFDLQTADWVKVRGDQLVPRNGGYDVRVVANLWETHFYDKLALVAVDHPADTELFVDERASLTPSQLAYHLVERPRPVARAWDHHGADVTSIVSAVDGVYLDRVPRGPFRGVTEDRWVEIDLGPDAPRQGPAWLIARGWVNPVDSTTYFALAQGHHEQPREPSLEVPDGKGGWRVVRTQLGYPAGKDKDMLIRLDGADGPGVPRRFRLRTNMEIYWDVLLVARGRDDTTSRRQLLQPDAANLHFRGILDMTRADRSSPELPHYDRVVHIGQPWRNLIGFHTRYGDVRELLLESDDRYVILGPGDEMALRFAAPPAPPAGWKRDFVWQCDGWTKDGDLNTRTGKTVLPLPAHGRKSYPATAGRLEDDPVYRRHARDWQVYHTRYVTPDAFERGLRPARAAGAVGGQP